MSKKALMTVAVVLIVVTVTMFIAGFAASRLLYAIGEVGQTALFTDAIPAGDETYNVEWFPTNPPSWSDGPCSIYVITKTWGAYGVYGLSGVVCKDG